MSASPEFRRELKSQLRLIIILTLGFTIAFTWRQSIFDVTQSIVLRFINVTNSAYASIITSSAITLVCLAIIFLTSKLLRTKPEYM